MKPISILFLAAAFIFSCNTSDQQEGITSEHETQTAGGKEAIQDSASYTSIQWLDPEVQDLGTLEKGQVVEISWRFKNTGDKPLYIADAHAGCGCTVPEPPKAPIAPGEENVIKAKFNSTNFSGHVSKDVFVEANNNNRNNGINNKLSFTANIKD